MEESVFGPSPETAKPEYYVEDEQEVARYEREQIDAEDIHQQESRMRITRRSSRIAERCSCIHTRDLNWPVVTILLQDLRFWRFHVRYRL